MDTKTLKAALSAAIKVTITTTLVGCGGVVTTSSSGGPGSEPKAGSSGQGGSPEPMMTVAAPAGGAPAGGTAGEAQAGSAVGGSMPAPCASTEVEACYAFLAQAEPSKFGDPVPATNQACCNTLLESLVSREPGSMCLSDNTKRFDQSPARSVCCRDPATWTVYPACTPWGPPVPPELSLDALRNWGAA